MDSQTDISKKSSKLVLDMHDHCTLSKCDEANFFKFINYYENLNGGVEVRCLMNTEHGFLLNQAKQELIINKYS